jgi:hypothetical protein
VTVWVLLTFLTTGQPKVQLAFKTKAACERMVATLTESRDKAAPSSVVGYQCLEVPMEND